MNSDGCSSKPPPNRIQAWAPFTVVPTPKTRRARAGCRRRRSARTAAAGGRRGATAASIEHHGDGDVDQVPVEEALRVAAGGQLRLPGGRPDEQRADQRQSQCDQRRGDVVARGPVAPSGISGRGQDERRRGIARRQKCHRPVTCHLRRDLGQRRGSVGSRGCTGLPLAPSRPSQIRLSIGPAAVAPVPACSTMPTMTNVALVLPLAACTSAPTWRARRCRPCRRPRPCRSCPRSGSGTSRRCRRTRRTPPSRG